MIERIVRNAACTLCGCLCDDLQLSVLDNHIVETRRACPLARQWLRSQTWSDDAPAAYVDGQPASLDMALDVAAKLLAAANYPLIYGLGRTTSETQRAAVELAERLGAAIDSHTSLAHGATKQASQTVGKVTCTLGEARNRADFVGYWGADPVTTHPRHVTKYSVYPRGRYVPRGRRGRTLAVIDVQPTKTARRANRFLQLRPGADFEFLTALTAILRSQSIDAERLAETGIDESTAREFVDELKRVRFGIFFYGDGLTNSRGTAMNVAALLAFVRELNAFARFYAMPMRNTGNEAGADNVLSWLSGYPFAVDFSQGAPRYNPGEFSVVDLLRRGDPDAALIIGADPASSFPADALDGLRRIPSVVFDPRRSATAELARVHIVCATTGIDAAGTAYRMDKIPLPVRAPLNSSRPTDEFLLREIMRRSG